MGLFDRFRGRKAEPAATTFLNLDTASYSDLMMHLKVQLFSPRSRGFLPLVNREALITRDVAGDLVAMVMLDFGSHEQTLPAATAERWGKSHDELYETALINTLAMERIEPREVDLGGVPAVMLLGNGSFVAPFMLDIGTFAGHPPNGVIVSAPNWHAILFHPVSGRESALALPNFRRLTARLHDYTDPLSADVFWWHGKRLERLGDTLPPALAAACA
ncbi:MAG TPA: hypothetical protein VFF06_04795 [Polyangia bacterium]|nr:hypothetical protein [Polyangia bacterium]